ncbi:MAG TPA: GNAT family N-acetyltransferase [Bryobacteraceae bacterium]|jgi:GNAT superfamily N-acetyltransferase
MEPNPLLFRPFQPGDETAFRELNESWISTYFVIEEKDREVLDDPVGHILDSGGRIFMATKGDGAIGCCALLAMEDGSFEVAKMTVSEAYRGNGVGRKLLEFVIERAKAMGARRLYLETNSKLTNAIHVYEALGFRHLPAERIHPSPYARANVYMELML